MLVERDAKARRERKRETNTSEHIHTRPPWLDLSRVTKLIKNGHLTPRTTRFQHKAAPAEKRTAKRQRGRETEKVSRVQCQPSIPDPTLSRVAVAARVGIGARALTSAFLIPSTSSSSPPARPPKSHFNLVHSSYTLWSAARAHLSLHSRSAIPFLLFGSPSSANSQPRTHVSHARSPL